MTLFLHGVYYYYYYYYYVYIFSLGDSTIYLFILFYFIYLIQEKRHIDQNNYPTPNVWPICFIHENI